MKTPIFQISKLPSPDMPKFTSCPFIYLCLFACCLGDQLASMTYITHSSLPQPVLVIVVQFRALNSNIWVGKNWIISLECISDSIFMRYHIENFTEGSFQFPRVHILNLVLSEHLQLLSTSMSMARTNSMCQSRPKQEVMRRFLIFNLQNASCTYWWPIK